MSEPLRLAIERLGHRGDGVALKDGREIFVSYALPGEEALVETIAPDRARLLSVARASAERVDPVCVYFTRCGGCALQHLDLAATLAWKRSLVVEALRQRGLEAPVDACIDAHGGGRRRVVLHMRRAGQATAAGFMAARSHHLVAIDHCPVLAPALKHAPRIAQALGEALVSLNKPLDAQITATQGGLDVDLRGAGRIDDATRLRLTGLGETLGLARLSMHGESLAVWRAPSLAMGRAAVAPPPGGFLQATAAGEETLARLAIEAVGTARHVADLFSGCGPIALRAAETARVHAVELDRPSLDALARAARATPKLKPVTVEARDLFRRPLTPQEIDAYDAVVFDPPRAGAEAQARALAATRKLRTIVGVSCNPATFARDARLLAEGGWRLTRVSPVDQFRYSAHVEMVGVFRR